MDNSTTQVITAAQPLTITVRPAKLTARGQTYDAFMGDTFICNSRSPFYASARKLIEQGHDPSALLVMRHEGLDMDCLKARLGRAAKLTIRETAKEGPRFATYKPFTG